MRDNGHRHFWLLLRAAVYVARNALEVEGESSRDAREALASMARILSDEWDGQEGQPPPAEMQAMRGALENPR